MRAKYKQIIIDGKQELLHRYIMEQHIGRKLVGDEIVHHKDGNTLNNDIKNLEIMSDFEHRSLHSKEKDLRGANNPMYGKKQSKEARLKMSNAKRGNKNPFYGRKHTDETRKKQSEVKKGSKNPMWGRYK